MLTYVCSAPNTPAQVENGARAVAYRAEQLAGVASLRRFHAENMRAATTMQNALVESALVNARGLAWFFTRKSDVHTSMFLTDWSDSVVAVARKIVPPISRHLGHVTAGAPEGEPHPGVWPIPELAVVLVGAVARFVRSLDPSSDSYELGWFRPSPIGSYDDLMAIDPLASPAAVSDNPSVAKLTRTLRRYLEVHT
jgi:hypothetical protein